MKRKHMVMLIAECLDNMDTDDWIHEADKILKVIEDYGMLPPIEPDRRVEDLDLGVPDWEDND